MKCVPSKKSKLANPPKPEKIGREIQLFILSDVGKFAEFDPKWGSRWQIHKCVGSGVCCSEKFRDEVRATAKKQNFQYAAHNIAYMKKF